MPPDPAKVAFVEFAAEKAHEAGHIFADMAACEAALESYFGQSRLAKQYNNLFGVKRREHETFGTVELPTREWLDGNWKVTQANFVVYPSVIECFADRMRTLARLAPFFPHYQAALNAADPISYVTEVSRTWSTDPERAIHVIDIYHEYVTPREPLSG